jgi:hypothetical protein
MGKRATLLLIVILTVSSLIVVKAVPALASIPKPSVPDFTLKLVDAAYDVPDNRSIELVIKNQPFTPVLVQKGTFNGTASFYYNVRVKEHFEENWITLYSAVGDPFPTQSSSDNTVMTFQLAYVSSESGYSLGSSTRFSILSGLPSNAQIDFQVQALIGCVARDYNPRVTYQLDMFQWVFVGETSGWSNTQTLTVPVSAPSPAPTLTPTPAPEEISQALPLEAIIGAVIAVVLVAAGLLVYFRKRKHETAN